MFYKVGVKFEKLAVTTQFIEYQTFVLLYVEDDHYKKKTIRELRDLYSRKIPTKYPTLNKFAPKDAANIF